MKSIYIFCTCVVLSTSAFAQLPIKWGATAKMGPSFYRPVYDNPHSAMLAYGVGLFAEAQISKHLAIRPQIGWNRKGYQSQWANFSTSGQYISTTNSKSTHDYLPVDVTAVYRLLPTRKVHPFLQMGLRGNFFIHQQYKIMEPNREETFSLGKGSFQHVILGSVVAIGAEWNRVCLSAEMSHDFQSFLDVPPLYDVGNNHPKFQLYSLNLAYRLSRR